LKLLVKSKNEHPILINIKHIFRKRKELIMGYPTAVELAKMAKNGAITLEKALALHLERNHFPPIPSVMVPSCIKAIANAKSGNMKVKIKLPKKVTWKGKRYVSTQLMVEEHHLEPFIYEMESFVEKCLRCYPNEECLFILGDAITIVKQRCEKHSQ
jgi:hypothetical protein